MRVSDTAVRGSVVRLRGSLRTRVIAACALLLVSLGFVLCFVLPKSFEHVARESFRERTESLARGAAHYVRHSGDRAALGGAVRWLADEPDFSSAALLDGSGRVLDVRPEDSAPWRAIVPSDALVVEYADHFVAMASLGKAGEPPFVAVRISTERLRGELTAVAGLFSALLLLTAAAFFALTSYLVRAVLNPLDEIRQAAQHIAEGELDVHVPPSGDAEIDELGRLISTLGGGRRESAAGPSTDPVEEPLRHPAPLSEEP